MESPTGIIPEALMYPERKKEVVAFLMAQPFPGDYKRRLLEGWAITVGIRCASRDYRAVENSGFDGVKYGRNF
jgi:predicted TIM-barrel enzyme